MPPLQQTLGQFLVNDILPEAHRTQDVLGKSNLGKKLTAMAKEDPRAYVDIVSRLKKLGDEVATLEGVSVGLDDIEPAYAERDSIIKPAMERIKHMANPKDRSKLILDVESRILDHAKRHPGTMTRMALSGARGSIPQLIKTIASPVASVDAKGHVVPWLIGKSYAEGLTPADYWVTAGEARINTVKSSTSISEPGDIHKMVVNLLYPYVVTKDDCGTHNGISMLPGDPHTAGRYIAGTNELITPSVLAHLRAAGKPVTVRSPMTCESDGLCKKCQGLNENGKPHEIGVNIGVRAAQAMTEPLTQFALSAKHGARLLKGATAKLEGLPGLRQLLEIPRSFFNKAALAEQAGTVTKVQAAPHGGHYVYVGTHEHYVGPTLRVLVHEGQKVDAGDVLSEGVPKPDEVVAHKGLGAGRQYLVSALHDIYKGQGIDLDKRHLELLARADLGHVKITDDGGHRDAIRGDVVSYPKFREMLKGNLETRTLNSATGQILGAEALHYTVGTLLTQAVLDDLKAHGVTQVQVSMGGPRAEFIMKPLARNPLFYPDWLARMAHRYLGDSIMRGAHTGEVSDLHGLHPVPAYASGAEFGQGEDGKY